MIKACFKTQIIITLFVLLLVSVFDASRLNILSLILGSFIGGVNAISLIWAISRFFLKKSIALAVGVIVFKWSIIGFILLYTIKSNLVDAGYLALGIGISIISVLLAVYKLEKSKGIL